MATDESVYRFRKKKASNLVSWPIPLLGSGARLFAALCFLAFYLDLIESRENWTLAKNGRLDWVGGRDRANSTPTPHASRSLCSLFPSRA